MRNPFRRQKPDAPILAETIRFTEEAYAAAIEEARQNYRRRWLVVNEDGEHVAYSRGLRGSWDEWRAVQMMRDANPDRVGTRPIRDDVAAHKVTDTPSPMTGHTNPVDPRPKADTDVEFPDTFPEEWL